jgi:amino acid adenylation domain-containing protein
VNPEESVQSPHTPEASAAPGRAQDPDGGHALVHDLVAEHALRTPDAIALSCDTAETDYRALDAWADRIAERLAALGVRRGDRVGLLFERSAAMAAAVLGTLRAGAAYVPVDPAQPDARVAMLFADARIAAALAGPETAERLAGLDVPSALIEPGEAQGAARETEPGASAATGTARATVDDHDPAYLIYTSGTTGEPKGVVVEHAQLAASTAARRAVYPEGATFLLLSPLAFDSSVAGLWGTLTAGGRLVIATRDEVRDPERLVRLIARESVTRLLCVPSLYDVLLDAARRAGMACLSTLREVILAGEPLPQRLADRHFAQFGTRRVALYNEYGPTEATVWATYQRLAEPGPAGIGGPIPGARVYVLDEALRPVPSGEAGELCVGGAGVARGYFGRPEATERAFVPDPFAAPGARMYRTGDLVRRGADGALEYLGRRDRQVKVRGHRVEPGAVEAALCALPGVREALVEPDGAGGLVGFVLAPEGGEPGAIRAALAERLADAMVPGRIVVLAAFPRTVNGKVDRDALIADDRERPRAEAPAAPAAPAASQGSVTEAVGELVPKVAAAWSDVLERTDVPTDVNYFDLGGNSLTIFHLQDALEARTGSRPSVVALFHNTTVTAQAALIGGGVDGEAAPDMREAAERRARAVRARAQRAKAGAR